MMDPSYPIYALSTNRFQVAMCLFSNRSQVTSKCSENKKVEHEAIAESVTDAHQLCIYPPIDHGQEPIKMQE